MSSDNLTMEEQFRALHDLLDSIDATCTILRQQPMFGGQWEAIDTIQAECRKARTAFLTIFPVDPKTGQTLGN